jgi:hypothetical protein
MTIISAKRPQLSDGTGVNLRSLVDFLRSAQVSLRDNGEDDAAHYFEMFEEYLVKDVSNGKRFGYTDKVFGL